MLARLTLYVLGIVLVCAPRAAATPIAFNVSGTLDTVNTDRLTTPDAATSQGIVPGASINGVLTIDFGVDLLALNWVIPPGGTSGTFNTGGSSQFLAGIDFMIGDVSFFTAPLSFTTMLVRPDDGYILFIFFLPRSAGNPPFSIDEVYISLAPDAPFSWQAFSSIDPGSLQMRSWYASRFGGFNQLAFGTDNLSIRPVPEPSTIGYAAIAVILFVATQRSRTNRDVLMGD